MVPVYSLSFERLPRRSDFFAGPTLGESWFKSQNTHADTGRHQLSQIRQNLRLHQRLTQTEITEIKGVWISHAEFVHYSEGAQITPRSLPESQRFPAAATELAPNQQTLPGQRSE